MQRATPRAGTILYSINWYDCVKWANARSEKDGFEPCYYADQNRTTVYRTGEINLTNFHVDWTASGYRLPTEASGKWPPVGDWWPINIPGGTLLSPAKQIMWIPALVHRRGGHL